MAALRLPLKVATCIRRPMVTATPSPSARPGPRLRRALRRRSRWDWRMWLFVGACFAVGYGVTQRLMRVSVGGGWQGSQLFGIQAFPGTRLSGLRERFGAEKMEIRGDLDLLELERQKQKEEKEIARREAEIKRREAEDQERRQREADRIRLEAIERQSNPPVSEPPLPVDPPIESPLLSPPEALPEQIGRAHV